MYSARRSATAVVGFCAILFLNAQHITFAPCVDEQPLMLNTPFTLSDGSVVTITKLRFYVSHVSVKYQGTTAWKESITCHLVDAEDSASLRISLSGSTDPVDSVAFLLGVDSVTNVSGALGGDLDPTKGMYWTWNSGYINFKLEGHSSVCASRDHRFEFHLGGYLPPYASAQMIGFTANGADVISLTLDVSRFLGAIDLAQEYHVMSPGPDALRLSRAVANSFNGHAVE
jgi:hypothetical protein